MTTDTDLRKLALNLKELEESLTRSGASNEARVIFDLAKELEAPPLSPIWIHAMRTLCRAAVFAQYSQYTAGQARLLDEIVESALSCCSSMQFDPWSE